MDDSLRHRVRPDIVLKNDNQIIAIELTCSFETNTEKSRELKKNKNVGARARSTKANFLLAGLNEQQNKTLRKSVFHC